VHVHDAHADDPQVAFALSRLTTAGTLDQAPIGIFRQVSRPTYDDLARQQVTTARAASGDGDLAALIAGGDTWTVA
jgi:2-oxoglutarate ferredoxin oxidoreductase subunit beta